MAEVKKEDGEQQALPTKRKPELQDIARGEASDCIKKCKLDASPPPPPAAADDNCSPVGSKDKKTNELVDEKKEGIEDGADEHSLSNGKVEIIDRKGKGILKEPDVKRKGKEILVEESSDDDDELYEDGDYDSDLSEDPLTEVNLDNILPSRTRRRVVQPGVYISSDFGQDDDDEYDDDAAADDSDDDDNIGSDDSDG